VSYQAVRCEHCGDPAAYLKSGKLVRFRNEPICAVCAAMLGQENPREFLDFLRKGGKVVGSAIGRSQERVTVKREGV
jgi:CRISPR/Cas system-associated protein Cas10 (large subunit of type III CRISPR-Cas system)